MIYPNPIHFKNYQFKGKHLFRKIIPEKKRLIFILSTMRSGSTLLKALLAQAPDASHLPETKLEQMTHLPEEKIISHLSSLCKKQIIIFKRPQAFDLSISSLVRISSAKYIVLIRNPLDTIQSLRNMHHKLQTFDSKIPMEQYLTYWKTTYKKYLNDSFLQSRSLIIRYEDLVENPIGVTSQAFHFMNSIQKTGVDRYEKPKDFTWEWQQDDGSEKIKSLRVSMPTQYATDQRLINIINEDPELLEIMSRFGYNI